MGWSYFCAKEEHSQCYDTKKDTHSCDCPCHLKRMNDYRVDWSNYYEASSPTDALYQALADLETVIKLREGATGFFVTDEDGNTVRIDVEHDKFEVDDTWKEEE